MRVVFLIYRPMRKFFTYMLLGSLLCCAAAVADTPRKKKRKKNPTAAYEQFLIRSNCPYSLHEAATMGSPAAARARLQAGDKVQAQDEQGNTPLHLAAAAGQTEMVRLLLKHGASKNMLNKAGKRPADYATKESIIKLLK